ncbi:diaminopimelate epimerase [Aeoliella mucimassa]|uniref:Diaminopimelate epimerase n=1 Tax=Aeoliella mucimassa TaxID=2527972 RepID=A0A518AKH1_9BACT|nr:diaminopimelate epimerase [Aeoliella mucimassa]QDU55222.1 Diaminopimelate epimerase [Aeoliella mucimassa]
MRFTKMHGAGNDYVYVDCFRQDLPSNIEQLAIAAADRHFGIGGDGLILICPSERADAEMRMYNADGSYSEMCGNGIRCVAKYMYDHGLAKKETLTIESGGNVLTLELSTNGGKVDRVRVDMGEPVLEAAQIPTRLGGKQVVEAPLECDGNLYRVTAVSMGNPHCVIFVAHASDDLVFGVGPQIEHDPAFPNRVNVEFVEQISRTQLRQRTWERGSGETLACGTGASAVCVAGVLTGRTERCVEIDLLGGRLELEWNETDNHVYMTGPAVEVFSGEWFPAGE